MDPTSPLTTSSLTASPTPPQPSLQWWTPDGEGNFSCNLCDHSLSAGKTILWNLASLQADLDPKCTDTKVNRLLDKHAKRRHPTARRVRRNSGPKPKDGQQKYREPAAKKPQPILESAEQEPSPPPAKKSRQDASGGALLGSISDLLAEKDRRIKHIEQQNAEKDRHIKQLEQQNAEKDRRIEELENELREECSDRIQDLHDCLQWGEVHLTRFLATVCTSADGMRYALRKVHLDPWNEHDDLDKLDPDHELAVSTTCTGEYAALVDDLDYPLYYLTSLDDEDLLLAMIAEIVLHEGSWCKRPITRLHSCRREWSEKDAIYCERQIFERRMRLMDAYRHWAKENIPECGYDAWDQYFVC